MKTLRQRHRHLLVAAILLVAGVVRLPLERGLSDELLDAGLLQPSVELETRQQVGQSLWAVALGGLRTLVATVLNLRADTFFQAQQWTELADAFDTMTDLAPRTRYYWDIGSWHMAYNASAYYQNRDDLPTLRRRAEWRDWVKRGTRFLEEGVRNNPDDWRLWANLAYFYSDPLKLVDDARAEEAYRRSWETGNALPFIERAMVYAMARQPERRDEALERIRAMSDDPRAQVPAMLALRYALEYRADPGRDPLELALEVFGSEERAYRILGNHYLDLNGRFPNDGVAEAVAVLENRLAIDEEKSIFRERERLQAMPIHPFDDSR